MSDEYDNTMLGPSSAHELGEDFTDAKGRRWVAAERIDLPEIDVPETERVRRAPDIDAAFAPDPRAMAREDLARALQPRRLVGNFEYRLDEPDYEIADAIQAMASPSNTEGSWGESSAFARAKYLTGPGLAPTADRYVIGADDRRRIDSPQFFPGSAFAYLSQGCTATMIGPSTALCAAHCFFQNGTWIPTRSVTFGANTVAPTAPFGSFVFDSITLPGQWNSNEWDWDFAVLEFSPSRPDIGRQTGWFGTGQNFNGTKTMIGYPSDKPVPSSWIKSGAFTAAPGSRYQHNLDIIPGDSGAGTYDNGDSRVNGIQSTQWFSTNPPRVWNEVRRWDSTTYNFFHAYGNWPRG
ncbi:trypsin-like serine peptidase [Arthrobacter antioxidans]|uniref:trypsin-like serine peptidase n=1 Tax=Arthrobacter antioxidans TaxID=2895818 RepID=UPI001FFE9C32|nr:trypsin-like serine protease [Arthrobacter antioxidans]